METGDEDVHKTLLVATKDDQMAQRAFDLELVAYQALDLIELCSKLTTRNTSASMHSQCRNSKGAKAFPRHLTPTWAAWDLLIQPHGRWMSEVLHSCRHRK